MSRVGRRPIPIPGGTQVRVEGGVLTAEGPKGKVSQEIFDGFPVEIDGGSVVVSRPGDAGPQRARHGLLRSLLANAVEGASTGFTRQLEIVGVGYRAEVQEGELRLSLGYSHPVVYQLPEGVSVEVDKQNRITVSGPDKQQVGQVSAEIRALRKPDPYKGKGIRYAGEAIRRKVGKAGAR